MDKQLDGKFDKTGGGLKGNNGVLYLNSTTASQPLYMSLFDSASKRLGYVGRPDSKEDIALVNSMAGSALRLTVDNKLTFNNIEVMRIGDFGIGGTENNGWIGSVADMGKNKVGIFNITHSTEGMKELGFTDFYGSSIVAKYSAGNLNTQVLLLSNYGMDWLQIIRKGGTGTPIEKCNVWTNKNTTKDANGNLKPASPIIKVFADHIELNEESEGVELEKLNTGRYKLKGTLGMNSDASWGGYHGGLVIPNGINNLPLVWADFKVEADGDIIIETHYRKHADLPPPVVLNRLITYPEFMDENGNELDSYTPCDIPNGHWIDVRVNMPSDSLYNQKQAEAQRLAEIEAERLAKEEAERIAEEAERAERDMI